MVGAHVSVGRLVVAVGTLVEVAVRMEERVLNDVGEVRLLVILMTYAESVMATNLTRCVG